MKISRSVLLSMLKTVAPALAAAKNQFEELSYVWFDGKTLSAYDDLIGIQLGFETDFTGGVPGAEFIGLLEKSSAKTVTLQRGNDDNLRLTIGAAEAKMAVRPIEDWVWAPEVPQGGGFPITAEVMNAMSLVLLSVGSGKVVNAEQRGVTIIQNGKGADFYSTDSITISRAVVPLSSKIFAPASHTRAILPTLFCEQLKALIKPGAFWKFDDNAVYCNANIEIDEKIETRVKDEEGKTKRKVETKTWTVPLLLYSKIVEDEDPVPFADKLAEYTGTVSMFDVPDKLYEKLDRATVLLSENHPTALDIVEDDSGKFLTLYARTDRAEIDDQLELEGADKHPKVSVHIDPELVKRGLQGRDSMAVTADCLVFTGPENFTHIVATK